MIAYIIWYFVFIGCEMLIYFISFLETIIFKQLLGILKKTKFQFEFVLYSQSTHNSTYWKLKIFSMAAFKRGIMHISEVIIKILI